MEAGDGVKVFPSADADGAGPVSPAEGLITRDNSARGLIMSKRTGRTGKRIPRPYGDRIAAVREEMARKDLDGYLVLERMDQIWLTGFTGEDGAVLITPKNVVLLTDGRFDESAGIEAPYAVKVLRKKRTPDVNVREFKRHRVKRLGFDPGHMNVADYAQYRKFAKPIKLVSSSGLIYRQRLIKDGQELKVIQQAIDIAEKAFKKLQRWVRPGLTEREVAARLEYEMQRLGAQGPSFPTIVAAGPNASLPHYEPGSRKVKKSEGILIDWGARIGWYVSDLTRMIWPGSIPRRLARVYEVVREAHDRAVDAVRPGVTAHAVDRIARSCITKAGYGARFNHALGHGIGLDVHEAPRVGKGTQDELRPGMVITIEPGIYLPGVGGVRLESDVLVTKTGYQVLSSLPL